MFMGPSGDARTGNDGRFVIGEVVPGTYRVTASIPITSWSSTASGGGGIGAVSSGVTATVEGGVVGGVSAGVVTTFRSGPAGMAQPTSVVVADANVTGVRVVVHR
jgi:hypothetical protein